MTPASAPPLLRLMWLASPALPVGGFSYSEGLEAAVEHGRVRTEADTRAWLADHLHLVLARSDLPVVAAAFDAWHRDDVPRLEALNAWVLATRETHEFRLQVEQMGRSLAEWLRERDPPPHRWAALRALAPAPSWPVAWGLAATLTGATVHDALLAFAFGWAENMVQSALKSVPLGQAAGQRVLAALADDIPAAVEGAIALPEARWQSAAPALAILSSRHESQYSRLFRS